MGRYEMGLRAHIIQFCGEFSYPAQACSALLECCDRVTQSPASERFFMLVARYEADEMQNYPKTLAELETLAGQAGTHPYTLQLLYFICLARHARQLYRWRHIPEQVYFDSMCDLKWKLFECQKVHGVWGSFVAFWFPRFFELTRFALGRLQFETVTFGREYRNAGWELSPQDVALNVHIPSCGPLSREACLDSYGQAAAFYQDYFEERAAAFTCESWLLWPAHADFLPAHSNIRPFMADFDIIESKADPRGSDLWRLFDRECDCATADLPGDSSLRRAYIDWLRRGNPVGEGIGVFFWKDGGVLRHE
ncbi:MAG: acyltransferase domain-containing protein [Eubacteriales bacterium]|nr:acyltransferase domain-containing protein [Eubacteriales bacterium]